ncbi:MAG: hypothetical protein IT537_14585 [Hyphomicrobiales bacterium]|nr:hypothetical protein [Hyphomicrobiales bacterium]
MLNSRYAPHLAGGKDQQPDDYAAEVMQNGQRASSQARGSGNAARLTTIRATIAGYIDRREREAAVVAANTGPVRVLMRDGVWLVPENERPPLKVQSTS